MLIEVLQWHFPFVFLYFLFTVSVKEAHRRSIYPSPADEEPSTAEHQLLPMLKSNFTHLVKQREQSWETGVWGSTTFQQMWGSSLYNVAHLSVKTAYHTLHNANLNPANNNDLNLCLQIYSEYSEFKIQECFLKILNSCAFKIWAFKIK